MNINAHEFLFRFEGEGRGTRESFLDYQKLYKAIVLER
jgi:hypothetical protein